MSTFTKDQKVRVLCDVTWTDDEDVEHVTAGPSNGTVASVDERADCTVYEIHLDGGGYFLHERKADGEVVQAL